MPRSHHSAGQTSIPSPPPNSFPGQAARMLLTLGLLGATGWLAAFAEPASDDPQINSIFQYFAPSTVPKAQPNSGAYLWIPPAAAKIRAVMVGIHNGLPLPILRGKRRRGTAARPC